MASTWTMIQETIRLGGAPLNGVQVPKQGRTATKEGSERDHCNQFGCGWWHNRDCWTCHKEDGSKQENQIFRIAQEISMSCSSQYKCNNCTVFDDNVKKAPAPTTREHGRKSTVGQTHPMEDNSCSLLLSHPTLSTGQQKMRNRVPRRNHWISWPHSSHAGQMNGWAFLALGLLWKSTNTCTGWGLSNGCVFV